VTVSGGGGYVVNPNTKNPAEAWQFIAFAYSKASLDEFQKIEPRIRSRDDVPVPNEPVMTALAKEVQPITTKRPEDAAYSTVVSPQIQLMTERVVSGEMTPPAAMEAFAKAVTDAVGANKVEDAK
ncbi:MAG: ABC transporter substrate-binding protein, partial [Chloroflexi bacterium]|nr:ABC transporter substrate-binding protein [Chloroflexota bacterium]